MQQDNNTLKKYHFTLLMLIKRKIFWLFSTETIEKEDGLKMKAFLMARQKKQMKG